MQSPDRSIILIGKRTSTGRYHSTRVCFGKKCECMLFGRPSPVSVQSKGPDGLPAAKNLKRACNISSR